MTIQLQAKQLLWHYGNLDYLLRPEQLAIKEVLTGNNNMLFVANCSRRLGKSFMMAAYCIEQAIKVPGSRIIYGTAFLSELVKFIIPAFEMILQDSPDILKPRYLTSSKRYIFPNGSEISLVGVDRNPNGLRGNAITTIVLDEAAFVTNLETIYKNVIMPATMEQTNVKIILISTPPESPEHYFVELMNKAKLANAYCEFDITHKTTLTKEEFDFYMEEAGGATSTTALREYFCKIVIETNRAAVPDFKEEIHVKEFDKPEHSIWLVAGDIGGTMDKSCFLLMTYDYLNNKILVVDERYYSPHVPSSVMIAGAKDMEKGHKVTRIVDFSGRTQIDYSFEHSYPAALPMKDDFHAGLTLLRNTFHKDTILIHPRCKFLIQSLKGGMLTKNRSDYMRSEALGHLDAIATLIYGLRHVDKHTNPYPPKDPFNTFRPFDPNQKRKDNLKKAFGS